MRWDKVYLLRDGIIIGRGKDIEIFFLLIGCVENVVYVVVKKEYEVILFGYIVE